MLTGRDTGAVQHIRGAEAARPRPQQQQRQRRRQQQQQQRSHHRQSRRQPVVGAGREYGRPYGTAHGYDTEWHQGLSWEKTDDAAKRAEDRCPPESFREWWAFCTDDHLAAAAADGSREAWTAAHEFERTKWESVARHGRDRFTEWRRDPRDTFIRGADPAVRLRQEPEPETHQLQPAPTPALSQPMRPKNASGENIAPRALSANRSIATLSRRPRLQFPPSAHKPEELAAARVQTGPQARNPPAALAYTSNSPPALPAWQTAPFSSQLPPPPPSQAVGKPKEVSYHTELQPTDDPEHAEGSAATVQQDRNQANSAHTVYENEQSLPPSHFLPSESVNMELPPPPPPRYSPHSSADSTSSSQQQHHAGHGTTSAAAADVKQRATALADFKSEEPGDLQFNVGEIITVTSQVDDWWVGYREADPSFSGEFPSTYVELQKPSGSMPAVGGLDSSAASSALSAPSASAPQAAKGTTSDDMPTVPEGLSKLEQQAEEVDIEEQEQEYQPPQQQPRHQEEEDRSAATDFRARYEERYGQQFIPNTSAIPAMMAATAAAKRKEKKSKKKLTKALYS